MASMPARANVEKPSFAKIVAAGIKPSNVQPKSNNYTTTLQKHAITSSPQDVSRTVAPSNDPRQPEPRSLPKKLVQPAWRSSKEPDTDGVSKPEVLVHEADHTSTRTKEVAARDGCLAPVVCDENGTHISSSTNSAKAPSFDGKSVASGTTFALDEKESLRPDDSASVKAIDDEDVFSPPSSGLPGSYIGSEEGVRAFRDQLREISSMDSARREVGPPVFGPSPLPPQGVLYVPPQDLGVGVLPPVPISANDTTGGVDILPDSKLLEALDSPRDRIWVLKLEQDIYDFVKDAKESSLNLPQCNAYHRMLAHKIADYYMLGHIVDDSGDGVRLYKTPNCRIPPPLTGITTPSTAASTPPPAAPQMKILRRGVDTDPAIANGSNIPSKTTSENGDSGNDDDKKNRPPASREEREARYEAARLRIMGSARPAEVPEAPKEKDESRSSSAAGKKPKKKQRSDSEDGFEARSAYSAYFTSQYSTNALSSAPPQYGFQSFDVPNGNNVASGNFKPPEQQQAYHQFPLQSPVPALWNDHGVYASGSSSQGWVPAQHPGYDLSNDFQRSMCFQSPAQSPNMHAGYQHPYNSSGYGAPQPWSPPTLQPPSQPQQPHYGYVRGHSNQPGSPVNQTDAQPYAYGQLPSQTFPGRPPSKLEHPIPGSYKSKHFNPQSQAFVPGQPNGNTIPPFTHPSAQTNAAFGGMYGMPGPMQRQPSAHSQNPTIGSPQHIGSAMTPSHAPIQPMIHPLPQPVFPRQPSPSLPLPPKPGSTPQKPAFQANMPSPAMSGQNSSSIAKWGTPASLPAKPPPSSELFDPSRFPQLQHQPSYNAAAATTRVSSGNMPSFGSLPPMGDAYAQIDSIAQPGKRT